MASPCSAAYLILKTECDVGLFSPQLLQPGSNYRSVFANCIDGETWTLFCCCCSYCSKGSRGNLDWTSKYPQASLPVTQNLFILDLTMRRNSLFLFLSSVILLAGTTNAKCYDPTPAFLPPKLDPSDPILRSAFASLGEAIETFAADDGFNATSFSIEVSSVDTTLWSHHHTAQELNSSRPGAHPVTDHSFYRIASITKTFTTLALLEQAAAGTLNLDEPVNKYLPELDGAIPWKDITLRTLASQLSGIPRDCTFPLNSTA